MSRTPLIATIAATLALTAAGLSICAATAEDAPVYIEGAQYTAVVDQAEGRWRLLPLDGHDLNVDVAPCGITSAVPEGVWLIERDGAGQPELRAPSTTALPAGHPGTVALRACGDDTATDGPALRAPRPLIDWLVASAGAVYVDG